MSQSSLRLFFAGVVSLVLALGLCAGTAVAAPRKVAYRCGPDLCLLDPDNPSDVVNLTANGATSYDEDPVWSPDGKKLAFVARFTSKFPPQTNIYTMEPGATEQADNIAVQVTHFENGEVPTAELAWSPDGSKIAFARGNASPGAQPLYVTKADGSSANPLVLAPTGGGHPSWGPDSGKIAFWHSNQIYLINADGSGGPTPLANGVGKEPAWSPDGSRIAFGHPAHPAEFLDMQIASLSGAGLPLTITANTQFAFASWSPSGAQLAYHETAPSGEETYFRVVNADGSGNHHLPIVQDLNANGPAPSWSPDGSRLVFQGFFYGDISTEADNTNKVYIANSNGSGSVTSITGDQGFSTEPAWRPNPVANPGPAVITPSGGSNGPLPGPTIKPKLVWFTNRVPWTSGGYIPLLKVFCGDITCGANVRGKSKGAIPAGLSFRPLLATSSGKPKKGKKGFVVGRGKVTVPANRTRTLKMKLTKTAIAVLKKVGELKMVVTLTLTARGAKPVKRTHTLEIVAAPAKHGQRH